MSDKKHIEYCIRLGNTQVQSKLEQFRDSNYIAPSYNEMSKDENDNLSFRERLQNWK